MPRFNIPRRGVGGQNQKINTDSVQGAEAKAREEEREGAAIQNIAGSLIQGYGMYKAGQEKENLLNLGRQTELATARIGQADGAGWEGMLSELAENPEFGHKPEVVDEALATYKEGLRSTVKEHAAGILDDDAREKYIADWEHQIALSDENFLNGVKQHEDKVMTARFDVGFEQAYADALETGDVDLLRAFSQGGGDPRIHPKVASQVDRKIDDARLAVAETAFHSDSWQDAVEGVLDLSIEDLGFNDAGKAMKLKNAAKARLVKETHRGFAGPTKGESHGDFALRLAEAADTGDMLGEFLPESQELAKAWSSTVLTAARNEALSVASLSAPESGYIPGNQIHERALDLSWQNALGSPASLRAHYGRFGLAGAGGDWFDQQWNVTSPDSQQRLNDVSEFIGQLPKGIQAQFRSRAKDNLGKLFDDMEWPKLAEDAAADLDFGTAARLATAPSGAKDTMNRMLREAGVKTTEELILNSIDEELRSAVPAWEIRGVAASIAADFSTAYIKQIPVSLESIVGFYTGDINSRTQESVLTGGAGLYNAPESIVPGSEGWVEARLGDVINPIEGTVEGQPFTVRSHEDIASATYLGESDAGHQWQLWVRGEGGKVSQLQGDFLTVPTDAASQTQTIKRMESGKQVPEVLGWQATRAANNGAEFTPSGELAILPPESAGGKKPVSYEKSIGLYEARWQDVAGIEDIQTKKIAAKEIRAWRDTMVSVGISDALRRADPIDISKLGRLRKTQAFFQLPFQKAFGEVKPYDIGGVVEEAIKGLPMGSTVPSPADLDALIKELASDRASSLPTLGEATSGLPWGVSYIPEFVSEFFARPVRHFFTGSAYEKKDQ